jgi:hypothetical protein
VLSKLGVKMNADEIERLFIGGLTMREIASQAGVTSQRIQQILSKRGLNSTNGGASIVRNARKEARLRQEQEKIAEMESRYHIVFGCRRDECLDAPKSAERQFKKQRRNSSARGVSFEMSFADWWAVWSASGKYDERGQGKYVMARKGDAGPYKKGNVYICSSSQNTKDSYVNKPFSERKRAASAERGPSKKGWSYTNGRYGARINGKWIGFYDTPEEAREKYLRTFPRQARGEMEQIAGEEE